MDTRPDDEHDAVLLARIAEGDMAAMRALYLAHADALHRFVRVRIRDGSEIADIVHETMLGVWRGAGGFEGRSTVRSWIFGLARHKATDHLRRQARIRLDGPDETVPDDEPSVETVIAASQDAERVRLCVGKLPQRQRAAIHLAFFEDLTYAQISEAEGVPEGTIKTRIFHAKKLLMRCLSRWGT
jgi:RNA polymerase sigma-70 factor (ECF subfamily)